MRVVFMGTPTFAVPALRAVASAHDVLGVYTRPDSVSGRGSRVRPCAVKQEALALGLHVLQPQTLKDPLVQAEFAALAPDVAVVAAYGLILPSRILEVPVHGCLNIHASLLPRWRGAAPIQRAILAGDKRAGVSIMRMEEGLDTGPFCVADDVDVGHMSACELEATLAALGAKAILQALDRIQEGTCDWVSQEPAGVTYAEKLSKADVRIDPKMSTAEALRRIRASGDSAPTRIAVGGSTMRVMTAQTFAGELGPGEHAPLRDGLALGFADGALLATEIKPEGKSAMRAADWLRGAHIEPGHWGAPS